jgi:hypothetical protein
LGVIAETEVGTCGSRLRRLSDIELTLQDASNAASLAMLLVTEGHLRYYRSHPERNYRIDRWEPTLRIHMVDEDIVRWASKVMGGTHVTFDRSMGAWYTEARGSRAIQVLTRIQPFVIGEKATMVECVLRFGKYVVSNERPCTECESESILKRRLESLRQRGLL